MPKAGIDTHTQGETTPPPGEQALTVMRLASVGKTFADGTVAIRDLDLTIRDRMFATIIGASGAGKSTVLRMMAGLETPTTGSITRAPDIAMPGRVSMVFQDPALMPWASALDNVLLPLRIAGAAKRDAPAKALEALDLVGLADRSAALPKELSGGMRMRVSIARALVTEPRLVLLDEPFGALDEMTRHHLNDVLHALWDEQGLTVVFVTHSVFEAVFLSTDVFALPSAGLGEVAHLAVPQDIARNAAFRSSAGFLNLAQRLSGMLSGTS